MTASTPPTLDPQAAARWAALAPAEGAAPWLHEEVARRMAERLTFIRLPVQRWADWAPGRGGTQGRALVAARYQDSECFLVSDQAGRAQAATKKEANRWWPFGRRQRVVPRVAPPEVPDASLQLVWANMLLHQVADPAALLGEWHRTLATDGFVMFSCLGPDTLRELRALYQQRGWGEPAQAFTDMHDLGDMLVGAGFAEPVMDMEHITLTFASPERLLAELRELGRNLHRERFGALRGRNWRADLVRAIEGTLGAGDSEPAYALTFEIIYGHALKPQARMAVAPETSVSLQRMRDALRESRGGGGPSNPG
ncbi:methyltransferase domain-containing protein [Ottowia sp.]|uniref:class I SAM-dependent methyltransferase n=1 Tax=Ottowia sp. TaxID=1898956 RepID=UPI002619B7C9|nr:methyltransferase domain-containing protein [Ottowia sp.]